MTLLDDIRTERARLEALQIEKGFVTPSIVRDALPPTFRELMRPYEIADIAKKINRALYPEAQETLPDVKNRAAGDA